MSDLIGDGKPGACRAAAPEKPRQEARGAQHFSGAAVQSQPNSCVEGQGSE